MNNSERAKEVLHRADEEARRTKHSITLAEHVLLGLLADRGGVSAKVLKILRLDVRHTQLEIEKHLRTEAQPNELTNVVGVNAVVARAREETQLLGSNQIGTEHLLLGIL